MAVYTKLSDESLLDVLSNFSTAPVKVIQGIIKGSENSNYFVETSNSKYVLTIFEERINEENIPCILDTLSSLSEQNIICPNIITANSGQRRHSLDNGKICVLQTFMDGEDVNNPSPIQCYAAGKTLANIHNVTSNMEISYIENSIDLENLSDLSSKIKSSTHKLSEEVEDALALIFAEIKFLQQYSFDGLPSGFIHGDYFKDNVLFTESFVSGVIDFWFACIDSYIYDLSIALNAWGFEKGIFNEDSFYAFLQGYTDRRPLNDDEKEVLPLMLRLSSLRFLVTRLYDEVNGKNKSVMLNKPFQTWQKRLQYHQQKTWEF